MAGICVNRKGEKKPTEGESPSAKGNHEDPFGCLPHVAPAPNESPFISPPPTLPNTDMGLRDSLSELKGKFKHKLAWSSRKSDRTGAGASEERVEQAGPPLRPGPRVVAGGGRDEENRANTDGQSGRPPQPDQPDFVPICRSENDREGREEDVDRREVSQRYPLPNIEAAVGSGPGREGNGVHGENVERVHPSSSIPSIPHNERPNGT